MKPRIALVLSILLTVIGAALWHGPVGNGAGRFIAETETLARYNLVYYEQPQVTPFVERGPVKRRLWMDADDLNDFQQGELARIFNGLPAIADVQWVGPPSNYPDTPRTLRGPPLMPMLVEVELLALGGYGIGLIIGYFLMRLRRRRSTRRF